MTYDAWVADWVMCSDDNIATIDWEALSSRVLSLYRVVKYRAGKGGAAGKELAITIKCLDDTGWLVIYLPTMTAVRWERGRQYGMWYHVRMIACPCPSSHEVVGSNLIRRTDAQ